MMKMGPLFKAHMVAPWVQSLVSLWAECRQNKQSITQSEWEAPVLSHILSRHWTVVKQVCGVVLYNGHQRATLTAFTLPTIHHEKKGRNLLLLSGIFHFPSNISIFSSTSFFIFCLTIHLSRTFQFSVSLSLMFAVCLCHSLLLSTSWLALWYTSLRRCLCLWVLLCPVLFRLHVGYCQEKYAA